MRDVTDIIDRRSSTVSPNKETADRMTLIIKDLLEMQVDNKHLLADDLCLAMWTAAYFPSLKPTREMLEELRDRARNGRYNAK